MTCRHQGIEPTQAKNARTIRLRCFAANALQSCVQSLDQRLGLSLAIACRAQTPDVVGQLAEPARLECHQLGGDALLTEDSRGVLFTHRADTTLPLGQDKVRLQRGELPTVNRGCDPA